MLKPVISVVIITYNHEKYIRQAMDSVLEQECSYPYEILVSDDCSKDATQEILKGYMNNYPELIRGILREENVGARKNAYDILNECRGKYVIILEGDDYWNDKLKLQTQADFLEKNPQYIACAHKFSVVDQNDEEYYDRDFMIQFIEGNEYFVKDFENGKLISHLNTTMFRNIFKDKENLIHKIWNNFENMNGDATLNIVLSVQGKMYCMNENMTRYRKVISNSADNFSSMQETNNKRDILYISQMELEKLIRKESKVKVNFSKRKQNIFASAVFKWYREKTRKNAKVCLNIIKCSRKSIEYVVFFVYLIVAKMITNAIFKEDRRIPY